MNRNRYFINLKRFSMTAIMLLAAVFGMLIFPQTVMAGAKTDEILNYEVTVDVNKDATLNMYYHIEWLVLDSDEYGPLTWANIGIPNSHVEEFTALSDNIDQIDINGSYAEVYFDDSYYAGDIVSFDFMLRQDYMYLAHSPEEEMCKYTFTPGWFDDFDVDKLTIRWNGDKVSSFTPECINDGEYLIWETSLAPGEKYTITTVYPSDAFDFNLDRDSVGESDGPVDTIFTIIGAVIVIVMAIVMFAVPFGALYGIVYFAGRGFSQLKTEKKITRTKVVYFPSCQGCGAVRKEGEKFCTYCGRSFIQSEEVIEEKDIPATEKALLGKSTNGEYRYSSSPNTYMRVNVVHVAPPRPAASTTRSSSSHHSSCAHSSCACACACACAGGGRAGCTTKDFYKTEFKLKYLGKACKRNKSED